MARTFIFLAALLFLAAFLLVISFVSGGESWRIYRTTGVGKVQLCKGIGIEMCDYEPAEIPKVIDQLFGGWNIWHEAKRGDRYMCYQLLEPGIWTKELLMFECTPVQKE